MFAGARFAERSTGILIQWTFSFFSFPWLILNLGNSITYKRPRISCYTVSNEGTLSFTLETWICIFLEFIFLLFSLYVSHRYVFVKINAIENIITIPRRRWNFLNLVLYVICLDRATRKSIPNKRARVVGVYTMCCCSCGNEMFTLNKKNIKTSDNVVRSFYINGIYLHLRNKKILEDILPDALDWKFSMLISTQPWIWWHLSSEHLGLHKPAHSSP